MNDVIATKDDVVSPEVKSQFQDIKMATPESMAFLQNKAGNIVALGCVLRDVEGKEIKFAMATEIFLAWANQMGVEIRSSFTAAKPQGPVLVKN